MSLSFSNSSIYSPHVITRDKLHSFPLSVDRKQPLFNRFASVEEIQIQVVSCGVVVDND